MKIANFFITLVMFAFASTAANAGWSRQCLEDCFSTGHDCNFCAYQCTTEPPPAPVYVSHLPCPLEGDWQSADY